MELLGRRWKQCMAFTRDHVLAFGQTWL